MQEERIVSVEDLRFRWTTAQLPCLEIPEFHVQRGERVFLYGPSGSGKSTLLGLLGGVLVPETGRIRVLDREFSALKSRDRDRFRADHIGFIFQQFNLISHLSVLDNVLLPCRFSQRRRNRAAASGRTLQEEAARLLSELDLAPELRNQPVNELSVGQQQRVAAARALIGRPEIIIADEPTSALDAERQQDFLALLLQECHAYGTTLLFVSHDRRLAQHFSREISLPRINRVVVPGVAA